MARALALIKKNPEAALVFYSNVVDHTSVGSVCKLAALLCRCALNFVGSRRASAKRTEDSSDEDDDEDAEDESFSLVAQIVLLEVIGNLLKSVHELVMTDDCYSECKKFLLDHLSADALTKLLEAFSEDKAYHAEARAALWKIVGYLGELSEDDFLEHLVHELMDLGHSSSQKQLHAMVDCLAKWNQLPFLITKIREFLIEWTRQGFQNPVQTSNTPSFGLHPVVALSTIERIIHSPVAECPLESLEGLFATLQTSVDALLKITDASALLAVCKADGAFFGVFRLIDAYSKLAVMLRAATVTAQMTNDLSTRKTKTFAGKQELVGLQPSSFFVPPQALLSLQTWITGLMQDSAAQLEAGADGKAAKKKRTRSGAPSLAEALSPEERMMNRQRNVYCIVAQLAQECVALTLQTRFLDPTSDAIAFIDELVLATRATLADSSFDRAVFFQSCQLFYLLHTSSSNSSSPKPKPMQQKMAIWVKTLKDAVVMAAERSDKNSASDLLALACGSSTKKKETTKQEEEIEKEAEAEAAAATGEAKSEEDPAEESGDGEATAADSPASAMAPPVLQEVGA